MRIIIFAALTVATLSGTACNNRNDFQCSESSACNLSGGGLCVDNHWCAYPDPTCPSGYRYSSQDVGDGLGGICVPEGEHLDGGMDAHDARPIDGPHVVPGSWSKQIPGVGFESVDGIAVASDGSVFILGSFDGSLDLGQPLTASGVTDLFVTKFTSAGDHVWSHRYGGSSATSDGAGGSGSKVGKIKVLSNGDLVIAGGFYGSITLGANTFPAVGNYDVYLARLSSTGDVIWSATGGSTGFDQIGGLAVDSADNIALCGGKSSGGTFFGATFTGGANPWIARFTGAGTASWVKALPGSVGNPNCGVAMMSNGDVVLGGAFNGTMNAGGATFTSTANSLDLFFARFAGTDGTHIWSSSKGGTGQDIPYDVAASGTSFVVTGGFSGTTNYGGSDLTSAGDDDVFVAQFDATNGNHQFSLRMGGTNVDEGERLSIRSDGQIAVTGNFSGTANFGGTMVASNGDFDPFLVEIDSGGAITSAKSAGGPSRDEAHDVVSTDDSLIFGGSFSSSITVFNQTFTSMGMLDGYLVRYKR